MNLMITCELCNLHSVMVLLAMVCCAGGVIGSLGVCRVAGVACGPSSQFIKIGVILQTHLTSVGLAYET